jgi:diapolycopene oxygenase
MTNDHHRRRSVIVIGAGLGGLSAAISLAQSGYAVTVYDKTPRSAAS